MPANTRQETWEYRYKSVFYDLESAIVLDDKLPLSSILKKAWTKWEKIVHMAKGTVAD